jgi:hypothetical protein
MAAYQAAGKLATSFGLSGGDATSFVLARRITTAPSQIASTGPTVSRIAVHGKGGKAGVDWAVDLPRGERPSALSLGIAMIIKASTSNKGRMDDSFTFMI